MQIFANQLQFPQNVIGRSNDMTANGISLKDVQQFARAGPDQLNVCVQTYQLDSSSHKWHWISARICNTSGENGYTGRSFPCQSSTHLAHLIELQQRGHVSLHPC